MSISNPNLPKLVLSLRSYSREAFLHDLLAGITVGLVALPLAMAFGIASGVTPQAGIYTAVVAGFLISALGGSRTQIGGPTGAFVVIVAGIVARFGMSGLAMVTLMAGVILLGDGTHRPGHGGALHPAAGHHRIHQRHRGADRLHADQGLLRSAQPAPCRANFCRACACWQRTSPRFNWQALAFGAGNAWRSCSSAAHHASACRHPSSRCLLCTAACALSSSAGGNHRQQVRRHSRRPAALCDPRVPLRTHPAAAAIGVHRGAAGGAGEHALRRGGRQHDRRPAQSQRRTGRAGHRQYGLAAVRRHSRDRRHRPHRDQHPFRRAIAGRRHGSRAHAARHPAGRGAAGPLHSAGHAGRGALRGGLQHGRVAARSARILQLDFAVDLRLADHVRADRVRRSHGRGGSRHGARGAALHLSRCRNHDGLAR